MCKSSYIPIYLAYIFLLSILLVVCYHQNFHYSIEIVAAIVFLFLAYMILSRPYKSKLHNAGQIMNLAIALFFVGWMIAR